MSLNVPPQYTLVSSPRSLEGRSYMGYGIAANGLDGDPVQIEDISCSQDLVGKMVDLFNFCQLPQARLRQAVTDLLP